MEQLRAKLAERAWRQFVARAAGQGLDLSGLAWVGPPASDELWACWSPGFPFVVDLGSATCTSDPEEFEQMVRRWFAGCSVDSTVRCLFDDRMLGAVEVPVEMLATGWMVPRLLELDGDTLVIIVSNETAVLCDLDVEREAGRYEVAEILGYSEPSRTPM